MEGIRPAQTLILWAIRENAEENGGVAEISMRILARRCFVSVDTVRRSIIKLEERGAIEVERSKGDWNEPQTNRYRVLDDAPN